MLNTNNFSPEFHEYRPPDIDALLSSLSLAKIRFDAENLAVLLAKVAGLKTDIPKPVIIFTPPHIISSISELRQNPPRSGYPRVA